MAENKESEDAGSEATLTESELLSLKRKEENEKFLEENGIDFLPNLPLVESSDKVKLKSLEKIAKRFVACYYSVQTAFDYLGGRNFEQYSKENLMVLKAYGAEDELNALEKSVFNGDCTRIDAINLSWTAECFWVLAWALGFVKTIKKSNKLCDGYECNYILQKASGNIPSDCKYKDFDNTKIEETDNPFENIMANAKLRDIEEILDMLDLYYRYHWAVVDKRINPQTKIGKLNGEVVMERRKALEWLVSSQDDWNEISLDT